MLGTILTVGGSILGGIMQSKAAKKAASAQTAAADKATALQREMFEQNRRDLAPWREAGGNALGKLQALLGTNAEDPGALLQPFDASSLTQDPGYQFGLSEGEKAINRNMAARGMMDSGAALKALQRFNQDYAGTRFNEAFNRDQIAKNQAYNMLAGLSGSGQTAASQVANLGANAATNMANYGLQAGNARAAGIVGSTNALTGAMDDVAGFYRLQSLLKGG